MEQVIEPKVEPAAEAPAEPVTVDLKTADPNAPVPPNTYAATFRDSSGIIHPGLAGYYNTGTFSDLAVVAPNGKRLACHQVVLSAGSKRFAKILEQGIIQGEQELPVWGVDSDALESVVSCFYTGECNITVGNAVPVMDAAQRLEVSSLASFCEKFVNDSVDITTACSLANQALNFKMEDLSKKLLDHTAGRWQEIVKTLGFLHCDFPLFSKILALHKADVTEEELFKAAWAWLAADHSHQASAEELAKLVTLPEGLQPADLVNSEVAEKHGYKLAPPPPPPPVSEAPAAADATPAGGEGGASVEAGSADAAAAAAAMGVDGGLPAPLGLGGNQLGGILQSLGMPASLNIPGLPGAGAGDAAGANLAQLLSSMPGGWAGAGMGGAGNANDLMAQLTSLNSQLGLGGLGGQGLGDMFSRLGDLTSQLPPFGGGKRGGSSPGPGADYDEDDDMGMRAPSRGRGSGRGMQRGVCQVEGCGQDLTNLRDYHQRYKICEFHLKVPSVLKDGVPQRFCQQCGRFQQLHEFEGTKRSCKARLQRHNDRRRKRMEDDPAVISQQTLVNAMAAVSGLPMLQGALPATKKLKDGNGTPAAMPGLPGAGLDPAAMQQLLASPNMLSTLFPGGLPDLSALTASLAGTGGPGNALHMLANLANASDDPNAAAANANSAAAMAAAAAAAAAAVSAPGADGAGALPDAGAGDGSLPAVGGAEDAAAAGAEAAAAEAGATA